MSILSAVIGGTGIGEHIAAAPGKALFVPTPYGLVRGKVVEHLGAEIFCLGRHSAGHKVPPHRVNYLAIAAALKLLGVEGCFASAAVGSLNPDWVVGDFVLCSDFIDLSGRQVTAFSDVVEHRDFTNRFGVYAIGTIVHTVREMDLNLAHNGVYANMNGPRYETPAEIAAVQRLGGNLVGMTAGSEAIAMREQNIEYACVCVVTNAAAGMSAEPLNHTDVVSIMEMRGKTLFDLLLTCAQKFSTVESLAS